MSLNQNRAEGIESVLVRTRRGQREYNRRKHVYTHSGQDHSRVCNRTRQLTLRIMEDDYERKTAGELEKGESLLWGMDYNDLQNLDFIDFWVTRITEDKRYLKAKEQLFVDVEGRAVPRLEYELLDAAAKKGLISQEIRERRLSGDTADSSDLVHATNYLFREYNDLYKEEPEPRYRRSSLPDTPKRSRIALRSYLNGKAASPADLRVLLGLAVALESEALMKMYDDGMKNDGEAPPDVNTFWGARQFYDLQRQRRIGYGRLLCEEVLGVETLERR